MSNPLMRSKLLKHWQEFHPKMVAEMQQEGTLETLLDSTVEQMLNLLYQLEVEQGMDYQAAWEIALDQFFLPEEEDELSLTSQGESENPQETSA